MSHEPTADSLWRIEFAKEIIGCYVPHDGIKMVILSGSPPRGLSDEYSDLDILVFWDAVDADWLGSDPLKDIDCERRYFRRMGEADVYLDSQYFGALKVDIAHLTLDVWKQEVEDVIVRHQADPSKLGSMAGFLTALPLHGDELVEEWKERIRYYPDELAEKVVKAHRRFFVPGYLIHQAYGRGDILAYYDGLCLMLKNLLNVLAGLNRIYLSTEEPRWLHYWLSRMSIKPANAEERMAAVISGDAEKAADVLEGLMVDVMALISEHMPQIDGDYEARWRSMAVAGCREKPAISLRR